MVFFSFKMMSVLRLHFTMRKIKGKKYKIKLKKGGTLKSRQIMLHHKEICRVRNLEIKNEDNT